MKMFDFIRSAISHNLKDPHSKALPACRQAGNPTASHPPLAIMTQSPTGEELIFSLNCVNIMMLYCAVTPRLPLLGGQGTFRSSIL
jgi:hypothetical protein